MAIGGSLQEALGGSLHLALKGSLHLALGGWLLGAAPLLGVGPRRLALGGWPLGAAPLLGGELQSGERTQEGPRNLICLFLLSGGHL